MSDIKSILDSARTGMKKAVEHLENELQKIRAGKASPVMLDGIKVDYYGMPTPLSGAATVTAPDARTLVVTPFERKMIVTIERAIMEANLGITPQNDGSVIRIPVPAPSEERRKQLSKQAREAGEEAKVAIRNIRRDHIEKLKKLVKEGVPEDSVKVAETDAQKLTDQHIASVDEVLKKKDAEIMTI